MIFSPDPTYLQLADALRERLSIIRDHALRESNPQLQLEKLKTISEQITQLEKALPHNADPHLKHYLENCSYDKALAMLQRVVGKS